MDSIANLDFDDVNPFGSGGPGTSIEDNLDQKTAEFANRFLNQKFDPEVKSSFQDQIKEAFTECLNNNTKVSDEVLPAVDNKTKKEVASTPVKAVQTTLKQPKNRTNLFPIGQPFPYKCR